MQLFNFVVGAVVVAAQVNAFNVPANLGRDFVDLHSKHFRRGIHHIRGYVERRDDHSSAPYHVLRWDDSPTPNHNVLWNDGPAPYHVVLWGDNYQERL
ncbi:hypothetical protein C8Q77DRAFT_1159214 [Trametes polyzona]|nr:hypothetical protein C8Q77DRAFT_1159214 [Trametes polyzona]